MTAPQSREQTGAHIPAIHLLCNLGWNFLPAADCRKLRGSTRDVLLKPRLVEVLQSRRFAYKGEWYPLSPSGIDQIVRELSSLDLAQGLLPANEGLYGKLAFGITITEFMPDGKKHQPTIAVIDWHDPAANRWDVTEALEVLSTYGTHTRRPDIVCYVNGIPLVVIEARRPANGNVGKLMVEEGISEQLRNQRHDEIPQLFGYAQLLLALSQTQGRYATTGTTTAFWARWREEEFSEAHTAEAKNRKLPDVVRATLLADKPPRLIAYLDAHWSQPMPPTEQDCLLAGLLTPSRLLEFLRSFVLFESGGRKVIARYQQFFGTRALIARIRQRRPDGAREGGIVWHTTGSGKRYTMVFFAKALLVHDNLKSCRVVVVTDRHDLERQLAKNFTASGAFGSVAATKKEGRKARVTTGRELARRIGAGNERIIFTLVQKFLTASQQPECYNPSPDLIVLMDEGQASEMYERVRKSLPRAATLAFTGTPLLKEEKTASKFGPVVHAYPMRGAVEDGAVAPLLYEQRVPEQTIDEAAVRRWLDRIAAGLSPAHAADLKKKFAGTHAMHGVVNRLELIAWDIAVHFHHSVRQLGRGLKGQLATASKLDAVRYKTYLDATGMVTSAIIMSPPDSREGNAAGGERAVPEVQTWWNANVGHDQDGYEKPVLAGFSSESDPDLLIVVDRLLTGFDEPRNTVLYLDKPLEAHNLIQAIARVNRLYEGKPYGVLVDYRGMLEQLDTAIGAYQGPETRTQSGYALADIEGLFHHFSTEYKRLPGLHQALWDIFSGVRNRHDCEQLRQVLMPKPAEDEGAQAHDARQSVREDFYEALERFERCLQTALSSHSFFADQGFSKDDINRYKSDLQFFAGLRTTARRDAMETVSYGEYEGQSHRMVGRQVAGMQVRESVDAYVVHKLAPNEAKPAQWSEEKTRNETDRLRIRINKTIEQELADDPYAQRLFAEFLKQTIVEAERVREQPGKQYALFREFEERLQTREVEGIPKDFGGNAQARAYFGILRMTMGEPEFSAADQGRLVQEAHTIDTVVRDAVTLYSLNPQDIEAAIRRTLLPRLFPLLGMDRALKVITLVLQVMHIGLGRKQ